VADVHWRLHLLLALDENGLNVAALDADGDGDFISADSRVAGGMLREEGDELVTAGDAVGDPFLPVVARLDLVLIEPDIVPALLQVGFDATNQLFVLIVAVTEEEAKRSEWLQLWQCPMHSANPEGSDLGGFKLALRAFHEAVGVHCGAESRFLSVAIFSGCPPDDYPQCFSTFHAALTKIHAHSIPPLPTMSSPKPFSMAVKAVILDDGERCLLIRRSAHNKHFAGCWEWPGGKLDPGEDFAVGLEREVMEECGLTVELTGLAGAIEFEMPKVRVVLLCMEARLTGGTIRMSEEHDDSAWVPLSALKDQTLPDSQRGFMLDYAQRKLPQP